jgi:hypothetical protein
MSVTESLAIQPNVYHAAHQVRAIHHLDAVAELAVRTVRVEERQEELKILFLAVVRR